MRTLFISHYLQSDSWGIAARQFVRAVKATGIDVMLQPIYGSSSVEQNIPQDIVDAANVKLDSVNVVIQHTLPCFFTENDLYNIGITFTETMHLNHSPWIDKINKLNELWVVSESEKQTLICSGVDIPIYAMGFPFEEVENPVKQTEGAFRFYFIGEARDRKNLWGALLAYHREFKKEENVEFIVKTSLFDGTDFSNKYRATRLYDSLDQYPKQAIITNSLSRQEILYLHSTCDTLIVSARAESICLPIYDALSFGNEVICTGGIHSGSIFGDKLTYIDSREVPVEYKNSPVSDTYRAWETWMEPDIIHLQKLMRASFNNHYLNLLRPRKYDLSNLSVGVCAEKIKSRLTNIKSEL